MMPDMKTVMLIYAIIAAICAVFMAIMWHFNRKRFAGISFWLIGMILQTVGLILIILRGIVPDFISLIVSNTVIIAGILIIYIGLERFVGKKRLQIHNYILLVIFIAIQVYFTYVQSNLTVRIFNNSAITLILTFQCAWLMLRRVAQDMRRSASIIGIVFSGYVFISLMRIILLAIFPLHSSDFFKSGVPDTFIIIFYTMLAVGLTFSSILMINSRLIGDIRIYAEQRDNTAGKLKERVDEIHNYLNVAGVIILAINTEGKIALINRKGCEILGCGEHEIIGKNWFAEFIPERRREEVKTIFNNLMAGKIKKLEYVEDLVLTRKGEERVIAWHNALIKDNDGRITGTLSSGEDITERKQTEESLKNKTETLQNVIAGTDAGTWEWNVQTGELVFNERLAEIVGYTLKELEPINAKTWERLAHPNDLTRSKELLQKHFQGSSEYYSVEARMRHKDGSWVWVADRGKVIEWDKDGKPLKMFGTHIEITELKNIENEIRYLSFHDHLTGLYNRRFVEEEIKRLNTKRQLPLSVIMGDLNGLKLTNDTFGHSEGDKILKKCAELLKRICRSDDILARWGGDEFVILLPKTPIVDSEEIVQRIKKECSKLVIQKIPFSLSIGIATKIEAGQDIDEIIIEAESNMYKNKLDEKESRTSSIISALEQALYEKSNETMEHAFRIKDLSIKLGKSIKLASNQLDELSLLASLHDIGKVAIPETILLKEGKLTEKEWAVIKRHPEIGFNIAQSSPQIVHIAKFILACHENWDGSGYPQGLAGQSIPIVCRIMSIADAYDVMTIERVYKKAMSKPEAITELKRCAGTQFDPVLVNKFIEILSN